MTYLLLMALSVLGFVYCYSKMERYNLTPMLAGQLAAVAVFVWALWGLLS